MTRSHVFRGAALTLAIVALPAAVVAAEGDPAVAEFDQVITAVQEVRGLRALAPIRYSIIGDTDFDAAFSRVTADDRRTLDQVVLQWRLFGLTPPLKVSAGSGASGVLGFYDPASRQIYVRRTQRGATTREQKLEQMAVLAHEAEHALQHQHFGMPDFTAIADPDQRMAIKAVYEGDAMLAERGVRALLAEGAVRQSLRDSGFARRAARQLLEDAATAVQRQGHEATPLLREALEFQYFEGEGFLLALFRVFGYESLALPFKYPPSTTDDVFDSQRYILAASPHMNAPPAPGKPVLVSRLARLGVRTLLQACGGNAAEATSIPTRGDAYTIFRTGEEKFGIVWTVLAANPKRIADRLRASVRCWPKDPEIGDGYAIVEGRAALAFVRGLPAPQSQELAETALGQIVGVGSPGNAKKDPLFDIGIRTDWPLVLLFPSTILSGRLALTAHVLPLEERIGGPAVPRWADRRLDREMMFLFDEPRAAIEIWLVPHPDGPKTAAEVKQQVRDAFAVSGVTVRGEPQPARAAISFPGAHRAIWRPDRATRVTLDAYPICGGRQQVAIASLAMSHEAAATVDHWLKTGLQLSKDEPHACLEH